MTDSPTGSLAGYLTVEELEARLEFSGGSCVPTPDGQSCGLCLDGNGRPYYVCQAGQYV